MDIALLLQPMDVVYDAAHSCIWVSDANNRSIRKVSSSC